VGKYRRGERLECQTKEGTHERWFPHRHRSNRLNEGNGRECKGLCSGVGAAVGVNRRTCNFRGDCRKWKGDFHCGQRISGFWKEAENWRRDFLGEERWRVRTWFRGKRKLPLLVEGDVCGCSDIGKFYRGELSKDDRARAEQRIWALRDMWAGALRVEKREFAISASRKKGGARGVILSLFKNRKNKKVGLAGLGNSPSNLKKEML